VASNPPFLKSSRVVPVRAARLFCCGSVISIVASSIALKNPAWRDEKEVRCHHLVDAKIDSVSWRLEDGGGVRDGRRSPDNRSNFKRAEG
jgi:hypothetical protein